MTVSTEVNHNEYTGNGVTTSFPYTFRIFKASDLVVVTNDSSGFLRTLILNTEYTVTGAGSYSGGSVVLREPLPNGWSIAIDRVLSVVQETDLRNQGKFFAETHEGAFDYLTMLIQQCFGWLRLALQKPSFIARYYDAKQNRISNLADPSVAQDAVNNRSMRSYVDSAVAGVVGGYGWFIQYGSGAIYRTFQDKMRETFSVKDFGAKGDGFTNDTAAIQAACSALNDYFLSDGIQRTLVFPDGNYRTSATIVVHPNMCIRCVGKVVFQNITGDKSFAAIELQGGAKPSELVTIDNYGAGILIRGNTHDVTFQTISNCTDAVIIRADANWPTTKNSLDNKITGVQIGNCINGVVFEQNADSLTQQGNEARINFSAETQNTILFRNYGGFAHTKQSNWDSNVVIFDAADPLSIPDSAIVRNTTGFPVPNLTASVLSWCGGWVPDAGTICLIRGPFSVSRFVFNLAQRVGLSEMVDTAGRTSFGSCSVDLSRFTNLGSASSYYASVTPGASFNGGVAVTASKFRIRISLPDLAPGQVYGSSFWHVLVQRSETSRMHIEQVNGAPQARNGLLFELADAGTEQQGMVRIWVRNINTATVTARDVDFIVTAS